MNPLVYPVHGGMEDWAYAGSWEPDANAVRPCAPTTYTPYAAERTTYAPAMLRALTPPNLHLFKELMGYLHTVEIYSAAELRVADAIEAHVALYFPNGGSTPATGVPVAACVPVRVPVGFPAGVASWAVTSPAGAAVTAQEQGDADRREPDRQAHGG